MPAIDDPKPYRLTVEDRGEYLYARVDGEQDSYEISRDYWAEIAAECKRSGCRKILVEENLGDQGTMADIFRLGSEFPAMGFGGKKVAFVELVKEHVNPNQFGELVSVNRGFNVKMFDNAADAEAWLLADQT